MKWETSSTQLVRTRQATTCQNAPKRKHPATGLRHHHHVEGRLGESAFDAQPKAKMIPEELKDYRPYSQEEVDREMEAYFLRQRQQKEDERASHLEQLKQDAMCPASHDGCSPTDDEEAPVEIPEDLERMLKELAGSSPTSVGDGKVPASAEAAQPAEDVPSTPLPREAGDATPVAAPAAVSAEILAAAETSAGLDRFPVADLDAVPEIDDPGRELAALFRELVLYKDYPAVRTRCCQLSIRLNLIGAVAPAFRDWPRGVAPFGAAINTLITRDQIVIDYHWCYAKRMPLSPIDDVHKHLLDLDTVFDFKMAWELSGQRRKAEYRGGEALCLTLLQQCQTMQLRGRELRERVDQILTGYRRSKAKSHSQLAKATAAIGQWINGKPRFQSHRISYQRLWMARELLGPGAPNHSIAELHALMLGAQPLNRKTIAGKLETLGKVVDAVLETASTP